ncbi:MAG: hypothetical protein ACE5NW_07045 [Acidiferrobacterales bacterium]
MPDGSAAATPREPRPDRGGLGGHRHEQLWDCHGHLAGAGDGKIGVWANPAHHRLTHLIRYLLQKVSANASCSDVQGEVDARFLQRLLAPGWTSERRGENTTSHTGWIVKWCLLP